MSRQTMRLASVLGLIQRVRPQQPTDRQIWAHMFEEDPGAGLFFFF